MLAYFVTITCYYLNQILEGALSEKNVQPSKGIQSHKQEIKIFYSKFCNGSVIESI